MVKISPAAIAEIKRLKLSQQNPDIYLRLSVKPGGCLDFFYDLEFAVEVNQEQLPNGDRLIEISGVKLAIDEQDWQQVEFLKLDYAEDLMGGGFRFHNPKIKKTCGCGISFAASDSNK